MCEEFFGGELDVTELPDEIDCEKSQARQHRDTMHKYHDREMKRWKQVSEILQDMDENCKTIRNGIRNALTELRTLKFWLESYDDYVNDFEYVLRN